MNQKETHQLMMWSRLHLWELLISGQIDCFRLSVAKYLCIEQSARPPPTPYEGQKRVLLKWKKCLVEKMCTESTPQILAAL